MAGDSSTRKRKATNDDSATPNVEGKKGVSHRKKQAITKTNSAAIKAIIRRNQANSPLLKLAPEVREKILTYLVGDQVLHLHHSDAKIFKAPGKETENDEPESACIRYHICQAETSWAQAYHEALDHRVAGVPAGDSAAYHVANPIERHRFCEYLAARKEERENLHLSLDVLGVCRQLYEEANHLLWRTDTFTFNKALAFDLFFSSLNPAQKRNLRKLSFFTYIEMTGWRSFSPDWDRVLRPTNLRMLQGLTTLTLCFDQRIDGWELSEYDDGQRVKRNFWRGMESFVQFRMLPLKQVFVTISDDPIWLANEGALSMRNGVLEGRWTAVQKNQFAREWERKLLDADPAATIEAEKDTGEVYTRESHAQRWATFIKNQQQCVDACKAEADAVAANLLEEAEVNPARFSASMQTCIKFVIRKRKDVVRAKKAVAYAALQQFEKLKADMPKQLEEDAARRNEEREGRKRRQVMITSRVTALPRPTPS